MNDKQMRLTRTLNVGWTNIAMMDALVKDLDKEMTEAELTEKDAHTGP